MPPFAMLLDRPVLLDRLRNRLWIAAAIIVLMVPLSLAIFLERENEIARETREGVLAVTHMNDDLRDTQLAYLKQVSQWKKILLQGGEPAEFEASELIRRDEKTREWLADVELDFKKLQMTGQLAQLAAIMELHHALQPNYLQLLQQRTPSFTKHALANAAMRELENELSVRFESLKLDVQKYSNDNIATIISAVEEQHGLDWYLVLSSFLLLLPLASLVGLHKVWTEAKKLHQSQSGTELILSSVADAVIVVDSKGLIGHINPAAMDLTGWLRQDVLGKPYAQVFRVMNEDTGDYLDTRLDGLMAEGRPVHWGAGASLALPDGRMLAIEASFSPLSHALDDAAGVGAILVFRSNELQRSRLRELTREHQLFMSGPVVVFRLDVLNHWMLEYISDNAEKITGYPTARWRTGELRFENFVHPDDLSRLVQMAQQNLGGLDSFDDEYRVVFPNGEVRWFYNHGFAQRNKQGQLTHLHCYAYDISEQRAQAQAVRMEQSRFRTMFEQASVGIAHVDNGGRFVRVNQKMANMLGYPVEELIGKSIAMVDPSGDACIPYYCYFPAVMAEGINAEREFQCQNGEVIWVQINVAVVLEGPVAPAYYVWVAKDISERKKAILELEALQIQYQLLFDHMPDVVLILNDHGHVVAANHEAQRTLGGGSAQLRGPNVNHFISELSMRHHHLMRLDTDRQVDEFETLFETPDGIVIKFLASLRLVTLPHGKTLYQWVLRNISGQKEAQRQIEFLAYHDSLTGLPNRQLLQDRMSIALETASRHQAPMALMFLDMDHFKNVNDSLGHPMGDVLLQEVGRRLTGCVRKQDTIARTGGDEFVVLLTDLNEVANGALVARKIVDVLSQPYQLGESVIYTSCSIGISLYPVDGTNPELLMKHADVALYDAKAKGRAGFSFYNADMNACTIERLDLERRLHKAIDQNEFVLYYQPKIDTTHGRLVGAEALIRWVDPSRGLVSPLDFIPIAEESGLIIPIGAWVMREACRQSRHWEELGTPLRLSLNVSPRQLLNVDFLATLERIITETGANPNLIELELTEGVLMHPKAVDGLLSALSTKGFQIAVDDFGTGFSCLSYLKQLPVDTLKIDRSFVSDLQSSSDGKAIVQTIVMMAKTLGLKVVAEGVETWEQSIILGDLGCNDCQGYYFGKPMAVHDFLQKFPANLAVPPSQELEGFESVMPHAVRKL